MRSRERPTPARLTHSRCKRHSTRRRPDMSTGAMPTAPMARPLVHVEHVMGTVVSFDVRFADESLRAPLHAGIADAVTWLYRVDDVFSTYQHDSQVSRLGRGELRL